MQMGHGRTAASPRVLARFGGALYLVIIAIGIFGEAFVRGRLIVPDDPVATAARIRAAEPLWRFHIATELLLLVCAVIVLWVLFVLLRPAGRDLAVLAVFFNLIAIGIEATITLDLLRVLFPLGNAGYLRAFTPAQVDVLARLSLRSHAHGFGVSLLFFGCFCIVIGILIYRSGYLPKAIGVLMQIAGVCYVTNTIVLIVAPALADRLFPTILLPSFVAELSFALWLLFRGVNVAQWNERQPAGCGPAA